MKNTLSPLCQSLGVIWRINFALTCSHLNRLAPPCLGEALRRGTLTFIFVLYLTLPTRNIGEILLFQPIANDEERKKRNGEYRLKKIFKIFLNRSFSFPWIQYTRSLCRFQRVPSCLPV